MMSCKETARLISQGLTGRLSFSQRMVLRLHLWMCSACSSFRRQLAALHVLLARRLSGEAGAGDSGPRLDPEARERIRKGLRTHRTRPPDAE